MHIPTRCAAPARDRRYDPGRDLCLIGVGLGHHVLSLGPVRVGRGQDRARRPTAVEKLIIVNCLRFRYAPSGRSIGLRSTALVSDARDTFWARNGIPSRSAPAASRDPGAASRIHEQLG